jgi:hypothetical protein
VFRDEPEREPGVRFAGVVDDELVVRRLLFVSFR